MITVRFGPTFFAVAAASATGSDGLERRSWQNPADSLRDSVYPAMNDGMLENAWRLHQAGNLLEAARLYHEVLRADPKHFHALQLLGFVHFQRGEFKDAERIMEKALSVNPKSVDALYNRGCALQALERHEEAL